ncbi:MAG TPA: transcriptional regulator [Ruminococcaceae bacterium]|nr:transcriptional regulator [Oscillospiraceae bacterium]
MKSSLYLGTQLRTLRIKNGYTQQQISDFLGLDRSTYAYYETNRTTPPLSTLKKLARIFNVSISSLLENEQNQPSVFDPDALTFTDLDHNLSHIYELQPEERQLIAMLRLSDPKTKKSILKGLSKHIQNQNNKP